MDVGDLGEGLRRDLLTYPSATSYQRARLIGDLVWRNPAMAAFLVDLEADDDMRAEVEIELLGLWATPLADAPGLDFAMAIVAWRGGASVGATLEAIPAGIDPEDASLN